MGNDSNHSFEVQYYLDNHSIILVDTLEKFKDMLEDLSKVNMELSFLEKHGLPAKQSVLAVDLETSSLNTALLEDGSPGANIVGICLSNAESTGYYIPVGHENGTNLNLEDIREDFQKLILNSFVVMHNAVFDLEVLNINKFEVDSIQYPTLDDTMILAHLADSNNPRGIGLKALTEAILKRPSIEIHSLFGLKTKRKNLPSFASLEPGGATAIYGAHDAINTFSLFKVLHSVRAEQPYIHAIEIKTINVIRYMERNKIRLDIKGLQREYLAVKRRLDILRQGIFKQAGQTFNINSNPQVATILFGVMKIPYVGEKTASGKYSTSKEVIEGIFEKYPNYKILEYLVSYRKLTKVLSSYLLKLIHNTDSKGRSKFAIRSCGTPSGRFAAPGGKGVDIDGYAGVNIQSIPATYGNRYEEKPVIQDFDLLRRFEEFFIEKYDPKRDSFAEKSTDLFGNAIKKTVDSKKFLIKENLQFEDFPEIFSYWDYVAEGVICLKNGECSGCPLSEKGCTYVNKSVETSGYPNIRSNFLAHSEDYYVMAFDYAGVELRTTTIMSREPKWVKEFQKEDADLHTLTASLIYSDFYERSKADRKQMRQKGKMTNFASIYGGSGHAIAGQLGVSVEEGTQIIKNFYKGLPVLAEWQKDMYEVARQKRYTQTFFGRRRPIPELFSSNPRERSFGQRSVLSHISQGTAADIMKIALIRFTDYIQKNKLDDIIKIHTSVHDEVLFSIRKDALRYIPRIAECLLMKDVFDAFKIPIYLGVDMDYGESWDVDKVFEYSMSNVRGEPANVKIWVNKVVNLESFEEAQELAEALEKYKEKIVGSQEKAEGLLQVPVNYQLKFGGDIIHEYLSKVDFKKVLSGVSESLLQKMGVNYA